MRQILTLILFIFFIGFACTTENVEQENKHTNFIIILVDDMGYGDVGYHGALDMLTPNIDKLAGQGTFFTQGYVTCSVCGPSRAGLISGRYQDKFGIRGNFGWKSPHGFPTDQPMLQDMLKEAGYATGAVGKWHFGLAEEKYHPWNRNFDFFYGFLAGGHDYFFADSSYDQPIKDFWPIHRNKEIVQFGSYLTESPTDVQQYISYRKGEYLTDKFNEEAVGFIDRNHEKPFFLYLAYNAVHYPWSVTDNYLDRVDKAYKHDKEYRRLLAGMTLAIDDGVGEIMNTLEKYEIDENTAIIFLSDNGSPATIAGPTTISTGDLTMSKKMGLRGYKGDTYEGGIRVPFLIKWPGVVPSGERYNEPVISIDIVPTITKFLGIPTPETGYDGVDLLPYLKGENDQPPHEFLYWRYQDEYAYRKGDWKLTWNSREKVMHMTARAVMDKHSIEPKLFNIKNDPFERHDMTDLYPEKAKELLEEFNEMDSEMPDAGLGRVPFNREAKID